jgi:glycosyltransferase involved in cell wall biosynthesis
MNILYLRPVFWLNVKAGGSVGHTAGVITSFSKTHKLTIISNDELAEVNFPINILRPLHIKWLPLEINEFLYNWKLVRYFRKYKPFQYDFIYQRYSGNSFIGYFLSRKYCMPLVLEFNSSDVWKLKNWLKHQGGIKGFILQVYTQAFLLPLTSYFEKNNLKSAFLIVVVSEVLKNSLVAQGIDAERILVNPNGVDLNKFSPATMGEKIKKELQLSAFMTFGFIGSFGQWHGVVELAKAIVMFYEKNTDLLDKVKFLLIGDGLLMPEVKAIIDRSNVDNNVIFTGTIPQHKSPEYLAACDVFLSPHVPNPDGTKFFGSPTKLFEYMAMEKPIIASALDQIGEILKHNEHAYMVTPGNIEELALAIQYVARHYDEVKFLGTNARKHVMENFTWDKHTERIVHKFVQLKKHDQNIPRKNT